MPTGSGRHTCGASTSSTPSAFSSRPWAGPAPRSAPPRQPTDGPGWSSPPTPSCGLPDRWRPTGAGPGRNPARRTGSPPPAFAGTSGTSAQRPPARPRHQNPPGPVPDDHRAERTPGRHPATTCTRPTKHSQRNDERRSQPLHDPAAQVKDQVRNSVPRRVPEAVGAVGAARVGTGSLSSLCL